MRLFDMKPKSIFTACCLFVQMTSNHALAHSDMIGPLIIVEKVHGTPDPIGRIVVRYDGSDAAKPTLTLSSNLFQVELPPQALLNLPSPDWDNMRVPWSMTSIDRRTGEIIRQPYLYVSIPLRGPKGKTWIRANVLFFFDTQGLLKERHLQMYVAIKDKKWLVDLPHSEADVIGTLGEEWPLTSTETAEEVLTRALVRKQKELR